MFGVLPSQEIKKLIENDVIYASSPFSSELIQPSSLDLRLSNLYYEVGGEFCPTKDIDILQFIRNQQNRVKSFDSNGLVLYRGSTYLFVLSECLGMNSTKHDLPLDRIDVYANPKSTTGRLGISTRLISFSNPTGNNSFDYIHHSKNSSPLLLFVRPIVFNVLVRPGDALHQIRFFINDGKFSDYFPYRNNKRYQDIDIDLYGINGSDIVGYVAKRVRDVIDLRQKHGYLKEHFWQPIYRPDNRTYLFSPHEFYIMASKSKVKIRTSECAELYPYDSSFGEFRIHHAGFFDPGFGYGNMGEVDGAHCVFEITPHNFVYLSDGQPVASLRKEPMWYNSTDAYGLGIGSNYQAQELALAKQFI